MQTSLFRGPLFRGLAILAFFAGVGLVLVPIYVPRPAFIPGFAPPPDMWPRTVSIINFTFSIKLRKQLLKLYHLYNALNILCIRL